MAEGIKISSITIALLIVGLLVGGGGGYYMVSSNYSPKISELQTQQENLTEELSTITANVNSLEDQISVLEDQIDESDQRIQGCRTNVAKNNTEIAYLDHNIEVYQEKIAILEIEAEPTEGHKIFSAYGLWFQYPVGMSFNFEKFQEHDISNDYGLVNGEIDKPSRKETIAYIWQKVDFETNAEADLDDLISTLLEYYVTELEITATVGEKKTTEIQGHTVYYQSINMNDGHNDYVVYYATWFCNLEGIHYRFYHLNYKPQFGDTLLEYLNATVCHN